MIRIGRLGFAFERSVFFRLRPLYMDFFGDDKRTLEYYGLVWIKEISWLGLVLDLRWYQE